MRKCLLISLMLILTISSSLVWAASDTVIKNANLVTPFNLCFSDAGSDSWSTEALGTQHVAFVKSNQSFPICLSENLTIADYQQLTAFEKDVFVAVSMWQSYFKSSHKVNIRVVVDNGRSRFGGEAVRGAVAKLTTVNHKEVEVTYPSALSTMLGNNPSRTGYDIQITIKTLYSTNFKKSHHCYDQTPTGELNCMPKFGHDLTSVILHELGHGYGIFSNRIRKDSNPNYGNFFKNKLSAFDFQTNNDTKHDALLNKYNTYFSSGDHPIIFTGSSTVNYLRTQNLPKYLEICNIPPNERDHSQNFSHFCNMDCDKPDSATNFKDLMGNWCLWKARSKTRLAITSLDLHVLSDIGYAPILRTTTEIPNLRGYLFNPKASSTN